MKMSSNFRETGGFALLALLCSLIIILVVFGGTMYWVASNTRQTQRNEEYTSSEAAAEGATELIFANMDRDYLYGNLDMAPNYYQNITPGSTNWPVAYTFSNSVTIGNQANALSYLGSEYTNLLGYPQTNIITVKAIPSGELFNVPATVSQTFVFASVPAFQFAIFYNIDLEIDPGASMPINGAVFSNGGIWSGTANVTYKSTVEAAGQVSTNKYDPFVSNNAKSDNGTPRANFQYTGTPAQPESNVNPLIIPIGTSSTNDTSTNVESIINIPPTNVCAPQTAAYYSTNLTYDFNGASLIVSNWYWGTNGVAPWSNNFTVYIQDSVTAPSALMSNGTAVNWLMLTNDYYIISNRYGSYAGLWPNNTSPIATNYVPNFQFTNNVTSIRWTNTIATNGPIGTNCVWYAGFSFLTNATFYDYRESATVRAVQVDVGKLGAWIAANSVNGGAGWSGDLCQDEGHGIDSMFIYNAVPFIGQQQLPAVRMANGWLLPNSTNVINGTNCYTCGLTVVTPQPMYVYGSYNVQTNGGNVVLGSGNVANTYPAALMADAITVLSSNWSDAYNVHTNLNLRSPANTTINTACLEGIVPSVGQNYSGGVENFLRLLENWGGTLTYNGSIMVMFPSQYATNLWITTGTYYNAPTRNWSFDTNFLIQADLPPLTPQFRAVIRNTWSGY